MNVQERLGKVLCSGLVNGCCNGYPCLYMQKSLYEGVFPDDQHFVLVGIISLQVRDLHHNFSRVPLKCRLVAVLPDFFTHRYRVRAKSGISEAH